MPTAQAISDLYKIGDWVEEVVRPSGGIVSSEDAVDIPKEASPDAFNVNTKYGQVRSRHGYDVLGDNLPLTGDILAVDTFTKSTGSTYLFALANAKVYDFVSPSWVDRTAALVPAATLALPWSWDTINDTLILANYGSDIYTYGGAANIAKLGGADGNYKARAVKQFNGHLILFNTDETGGGDGIKPFRARWSKLDDPTDWTATGSGTFELVSGDEITPIVGAELMGDQLYVFKGGSIFRGVATGIADDALHFTPVVTHRGCGAQRTLQRVGNNIIFVGDDGGVYIFGEKGETIVDRIDISVRATLTDSINMSYLHTAFAWVFEKDNLYRLYIPTAAATEPDAYWDYNWLDRTWMKGEYKTDMLSAGMHGALQVMGDTSGNVYLEDVGDYDDATVGYASWYTTKDFRFHGIDRRTRFDRVTFNIMGVGTLSVDYSIDEAANWVNLGTQVLTATFTRYIFHIGISAQKMRFRFRTDAAANSYLRLREYSVRGKKGAAW